ncbi:potassium-transporting ATPase subunit KdpC [Saccharibacillus sp. CPCC 101409]|uniref:potassium-transporting ATPase subunit KdpC n=1 Tax=Saccharibacillus sp. CPCC 101409 TaxID=3058041 RepID=UPI0026731336|nr:potassium-transporting ATPase subunit KdpC [Saccharibacillus sp. CPCC 101409]MDO3411592.1 potassium-transporting ATPase subunit KdpC [Saccharibacillus sp. CPCC 101409]
MRIIWVTLRTTFTVAIVCCLIYNIAVWAVAQSAAPDKADGSLIENAEGQVVGSRLIGQNFTDPGYFHGRVSSIDYDANGSGTPNYAPSNPELLKRTQESVTSWQAENPGVPVSELPIDLVTNSGSGLDPHISPEAAQAQVPRVSAATGLPAEELERMIEDNTQGRSLGLFGEPAVNVLELNLDVQAAVEAR